MDVLIETKKGNSMFIEDRFCSKCEKVTQHIDGKCGFCSNIEESKKEIPAQNPKFFED